MPFKLLLQLSNPFHTTLLSVSPNVAIHPARSNLNRPRYTHICESCDTAIEVLANIYYYKPWQPRARRKTSTCRNPHRTHRPKTSPSTVVTRDSRSNSRYVVRKTALSSWRKRRQQTPYCIQQFEKKYGTNAFETDIDSARQFVQSLANPFYLNYLASQKLLSEPTFVAYLDYLQYWNKPPYLKFLTYPGPTLKHLELLQQERFREEIISPELVQHLADGDIQGSLDWLKDE